MSLYNLTERDGADQAIKELYDIHLSGVIEMLVDEPQEYNTFDAVDDVLQRQKAQFIEVTLEPLMEEIKAALLLSLNRLTVQTTSISIDAEGLKDAKYRVNVTKFNNGPF